MKDLAFLALMDIYGNTLTDKQRGMLADYYERDYSLSEIADNYGVSRQAVHFAVKQAEESLVESERKFGVHAFISDLQKKIAELEKACCGNGEAASKIAELKELIRSNYGTIR